MKKLFLFILVIAISLGGIWMYRQVKNSEVNPKTLTNQTKNLPQKENILVAKNTESEALPDGEILTEMAKEAASTTMTAEEYAKARSFKVSYPNFGVTLVPGKVYTAEWTAGKLVQAVSYKVRLVDASYQFDKTLGSADEFSRKFTFTVPDIGDKQYEKYQLVFSNVDTPGISGGTSDYFYIKNINAQSSGSQGTKNVSYPTPTASFTVSAGFPNGETKITVKTGDWANYEWKSSDADSFSETYSSSGCLDSKSNETRPPRVTTGEGKESNKINAYLAGCMVTRTFIAKNTKTGQQASVTTVVTIQ